MNIIGLVKTSLVRVAVSCYELNMIHLFIEYVFNFIKMNVMMDGWLKYNQYQNFIHGHG